MSMAVARFLVVAIGLWLALVGLLAGSEAEAGAESSLGEAKGTSSPMEKEIQQLRLRISSLEFSVSEQSSKLKKKAEIVQQLENIVEEESATIDSPKREMKSLQKREAVDAQRTLGKADARARELGKQVDDLMNKLRSQSKKREDLEARASRSENEMGELSLKLERLETRNDDQRHRLQETQHALKILQNWIHAMKERCKKFRMHNGLLIQCLTNKLARAYTRCQAIIVLHIVKLQELLDPYLQGRCC